MSGIHESVDDTASVFSTLNPDAFFDRMARMEDELAQVVWPEGAAPAADGTRLGRVLALGAATLGIVAAAGALTHNLVA